ncbi:cell division protein FtsQ/DivIB [Halalkalibacillus halophilus]|uniref:cell division protein FtsQ/DivIB n=1 Tax=Halalkalibacillus halophilus TaxID=392827 RepID=UPI0004124A6F|nr:FtsQ-type POTRA domain-containing protein [Halalkalibacillus halophilus]
MADEKIVSIENRIPKLKQARKKKKNRRFFVYLTIIVLFIIVIVYMQSSLAHIQSVQVDGNEVVSEDQIVELTELQFDESIFEISTSDIEAKVEEHPELEMVNVSRQWYNTIAIEVSEYKRVAYQQVDEVYYPILQNGERLQNVELNRPRSDAPLIHEFTEEQHLTSLAEQLSLLPESVHYLISEVYWTPDEVNSDRIRIYTIDGQEVVATIHNFASKMEVYPSIVSQLDTSQDGVIYIDVGAYFVPFENGEEVENEATELELEEDSE